MNLDGGSPSCQLDLQSLKYSIFLSLDFCVVGFIYLTDERLWLSIRNRWFGEFAYELVLGRDNSKFLILDVTAAKLTS